MLKTTDYSFTGYYSSPSISSVVAVVELVNTPATGLLTHKTSNAFRSKNSPTQNSSVTCFLQTGAALSLTRQNILVCILPSGIQ